MVRGITKEVEALIAIVIFTLFIIFYFNMVNIGIVNRIRFYQDLYYKLSLSDSILKSIEKEGYIITLNVSIPKYSREFICNISDYNLRKDFCENFPIFYPLNISFLTNLTGALNGTNNTILDPNLGIFLYANFSEFYCEEDKGYVIVKISNPFDKSLSNINVLVMSPTIYKWLEDGSYININESYKFCYLNTNGDCGNSTYNSIGIVIQLYNFNKNSSIYLKISKSYYNYASNLGKVNITSLPYRIAYEPSCYREYNFIITDNIKYDFSNYNDLSCTISEIRNSFLSIRFILNDIALFYNTYNYIFFDNASIANGDFTTKRDISENISCIKIFDSSIGEIGYIIFSKTNWSIISIYNSLYPYINLFYWGPFGEINFKSFFYIYRFESYDQKSYLNNSYFNILFRNQTYFGIISKSSAGIISYYKIMVNIPNPPEMPGEKDILNRFNISYYEKSYTNKEYIYLYLLSDSSNQLLIPIGVYYKFKIPNATISKIEKINYIDIEDLSMINNASFRIDGLKLTYGTVEDKKFSKSYYTYLLYNNTLIKDTITIYLK
ncbi:MAG: hypothetical protein BXU00_02630 [Candidatus Nanoclepta minutus]|uniref:Uncharacterized protein n=1 Tax=Candidatus Nanoclepta minutus TaxID=1940235 RepID=A0A397WMC0_9ARCH|nr:MAG: hypothetical protein BXU00_02630 [Candidatus Nanoclepta minutus]